MAELPVGSSYPLQLLITANGTGITGQTPTVTLQRLSDSFYWTGTGFTSTFTEVPLTEVDSVNQPGLYSVTFNQGIDNNPNAYTAYYNNSNIYYPGSAVEEIVFSSSEEDLNTLAIASAVAAKLLINPAIKIDSA